MEVLGKSWRMALARRGEAAIHNAVTVAVTIAVYLSHTEINIRKLNANPTMSVAWIDGRPA